jgi:hypothetical protein
LAQLSQNPERIVGQSAVGSLQLPVDGPHRLVEKVPFSARWFGSSGERYLVQQYSIAEHRELPFLVEAALKSIGQALVSKRS